MPPKQSLTIIELLDVFINSDKKLTVISECFSVYLLQDGGWHVCDDLQEESKIKK